MSTKIICFQLLLFAVSNDSEKVLPSFEEAAKQFKGKVMNRLGLIYVSIDSKYHVIIIKKKKEILLSYVCTEDSSNNSMC